MKRIIQDRIFTIVWSVVLFISTFPTVVLSLNTNDLLDNGELAQKVLMPMILVLALYLWEEMYNIYNTTGLTIDKMKEVVIKTFFALAVSIILIGLACYYSCFVILLFAWISISYLKYTSLQITDSAITLDKIG